MSTNIEKLVERLSSLAVMAAGFEGSHADQDFARETLQGLFLMFLNMPKNITGYSFTEFLERVNLWSAQQKVKYYKTLVEGGIPEEVAGRILLLNMELTARGLQKVSDSVGEVSRRISE